MKITIIGAGAVGATTAFALFTRGAASEVVLIDINMDKALGEALDIKQALPFIDNCNIYAGTYADAVGSDVVIITSGVGRKPGQSRLELVQTNVSITKQISSEIVKYAPDAKYIFVANPVDILTYAFLRYTDLPKTQVFGTGTVLDTLRLRTRLAEIYNVNNHQVHANVMGEHGESSLIVWSSATIAGVPIDEYSNFIATRTNEPVECNRQEIEAYVKSSGQQIISRKGCTVYGVAMSTVQIVKALSRSAETALTVSSLHEGEYGLNDVCISSLTQVNSSGVEGIVTQKLSDEELGRMYASAETLKNVIKGIDF